MNKHKRDQVYQRRIRFYLFLAFLLLTVTVFFSGYAMGAWSLHDDWNEVGTSFAVTWGAESFETEFAILRPTYIYVTVASFETQTVYVQETQTSIQQTLTSESQVDD